ncbi:uncharacterized protein DDB_G0283697, partial [Drosophila gunungcola]
FNLQEEASIPEDIFDQHGGDIGDEDADTPHMQYAPTAQTAPSAILEEEDAGDDDDVGFMEEDDDASEADIILESQRPTSRNFSVYLDAKKYQNNNKKRSRTKDKKNNISHYNDKLKNNKGSQLPKRVGNVEDAKAEAEAAGKSEMNVGGATKFTSVEEDNANFGRQSFAYKKLKNMHEQHESQQNEDGGNSKNNRKQGDDGNEDIVEEYPSSSLLFDAIEILNERKFNKPSVQSMQKLAVKKESRQVVDEAIGDIEDNLDNDEVLPSDDDDDDDDCEDEDEDIKSPLDNDELAKKYPIATSTTTKAPPTTSTTLATSTTTFSSSSSSTSTTTSATPRTPPTIGRKLKRNFFGQPQPSSSETRYYGSYDVGRIRAQEEEDDNTDEEDVGELHYYDTSSNPRKLVSFEPAKSEENYLSSYYAGKLNATERKLQQQQQQQLLQQQHVAAQQQHATRYVDDDYAEQQPPPENTKQENPWQKSGDEKPEEEALENGKLESDLESALQQYHEVSMATPTVSTAAPSSAFERFKAMRRSRQRTGHRSHKKRYKDYLKRQKEVTPPPPEITPPATVSTRHLQKLQKERERSTHSSPIFAVGLRPQRPLLVTAKPFYEGQVNYYDNQQQLDVDLKHHTEMERLIAHDNGNWYRRISPVLRNGIKSDPASKDHHHQHHHHHHHQHLGGNHQQHAHHHSHHNAGHHQHTTHHHHSHQKSSHLRSRPSNPYQRKVQLGGGAVGSHNTEPSAAPAPPPTPPLPPPKPQLGHQITELEHLERYYAKWPHLARVQFQVYDEHYRESHPELYGDYEDDYESAAELEEAQQEHGEEANLPPYIKKYNRRNKQLLNLLEGTLPTPTNNNPVGNSARASTEAVRLDDEYLKEKRRRYHQHQHFEDLFALQKSRLSTTSEPVKEEVTKDLKDIDMEKVATTAGPSNQLPEEDASANSGAEANPPTDALNFWQREMASKQASPAMTTTAKPALYKLPSYPAIAGSFLGTPRSRSRSAQFVANVAGRGQSSSGWPRSETTGNSTEKPGGNTERAGAESVGHGDPSPLNSFVYHRVVDGASASAISGFVGGSSSSSSRGKQSRLPFVAITDRRLEKLLAERHKDFEQNHFPMP